MTKDEVMAREQSVTTFVALLRGVNVGGKNMIAMNSLKASFEKLRLREVSTYINSGNVLFKTAEADARKLETKLETMLARDHQLNCRVVVRSFREMARLVESLPTTWNDDRRWRYNVVFLRHTIDSEHLVRDLQAKPDIEEILYRPGALLWSAQVRHITRTAMLKLSGQRIYQDMTVRNLNTTRKLHQLMAKMTVS
jgi:uncharacterized protein (DUF1697 family)